jgi:hypothetical protein
MQDDSNPSTAPASSEFPTTPPNDSLPLMAPHSVITLPVAGRASSPPTPRVHLTPALTESDKSPLTVALDELISYSQGSDCTRLNLTGRRLLQVKETTDQIDRLVRAAASQSTPVPEEFGVSAQSRPNDRESGLAA